MKKNKFTITLLLLAVLLGASPSAFAQRGNGGWGQNSNYGKLFNPQTVETVSGTVISVDRILPDKGMSYGVHLKVNTGNETISAHLGPTWYLDNQDNQFAKDDKVTITGSRILYENEPAIIVVEIQKNEDVLKLRDNNGYPVWSGWRKQGMGKRN